MVELKIHMLYRFNLRFSDPNIQSERNFKTLPQKSWFGRQGAIMLIQKKFHIRRAKLDLLRLLARWFFLERQIIFVHNTLMFFSNGFTTGLNGILSAILNDSKVM